jgi:hypothetical protein
MIAPHRFEPGQRVSIVAPRALPNAAHGIYEIVRLLPPADGDNLYRVKSALEVHERVVGESKLTPVA